MTGVMRRELRRRIDVHAREALARPMRVEFCEKCFEPFDAPSKSRGGRKRTCASCLNAQKRATERARVAGRA